MSIRSKCKQDKSQQKKAEKGEGKFKDESDGEIFRPWQPPGILCHWCVSLHSGSQPGPHLQCTWCIMTCSVLFSDKTFFYSAITHVASFFYFLVPGKMYALLPCPGVKTRPSLRVTGPKGLPLAKRHLPCWTYVTKGRTMTGIGDVTKWEVQQKDRTEKGKKEVCVH